MPRSILVSALLALAPVAAQALCTSDDVPQARAIVERFISADCLECWREKVPAPPPDTIVLDWIVPGLKGQNAPMASIARDEALDRLYHLKRPTPKTSASVTSERNGTPAPLRLAHGQAINDYVGTSMELKEDVQGAWHVWLMLVEQIPAGTEGTPVPRTVVRNVFRPDWAKTVGRNPRLLAETRAMQIQEGVRPERLRLVAVVADGRGRIRAITRTECP
ncbi:MAG TPA: hypothetical protein VHL79_17015 [Ramlibacter sp.]|nr:hypothetical protein [Ramlibacter sp.]